MKIVFVILFMVLLHVACSHLPEIRTLEESSAAGRTAGCGDIFLHGQWQLVHAIEIFPPVGSKQTVLGIIQLSSEQRTFHCVLMTIEGLVLFEADFDGAVTIQRALPPLDKPGMAEGIVQDISLLFFAPEQPCVAAGLSKEAAWICRYPSTDRGYQDIILQPDGRWEIHRYNQSHRLMRTIAPMAKEDIHAGGLPSRVVLKAHGLGSYELRMSLIEAVSLER
ncbi:MAG: hypothetical protein RBR35_17620 [Salinivirgaceae bacterium]|nr:hypothetical protein [Salinivirgaceae bacterium]